MSPVLSNLSNLPSTDFAPQPPWNATTLEAVRHLPGFPHGSTNAILALSDPPWYTACPNPYLFPFLAEFGHSYDPATDAYQRSPFTQDLQVGKNDPIYTAHTYHTKVPHRAIMHYIAHYTDPGDVVFDGFCGSGMTGVAAQLLGRAAVLTDLSPAATLIASQYNTPVDPEAFAAAAQAILAQVTETYGLWYTTRHATGARGTIVDTVWSTVFQCPACDQPYVFWEAAVDAAQQTVRTRYPCPHCHTLITKAHSAPTLASFDDPFLHRTLLQPKQVPVAIHYTLNGQRWTKSPDPDDLALLATIAAQPISDWVPTDRMPLGRESRRNDPAGLTHVHHFYTPRNLRVLSAIHAAIAAHPTLRPALRVWFQSVATTLCSKLTRYNLGHRGNGPLSGTLYLPSLMAEPNVFTVLAGKIPDFVAAFTALAPQRRALVSCESTTTPRVPENTIDYIFTDPPFGDNLMYSELNFLWEAWLQVQTNSTTEAIMNIAQEKALPAYQTLMQQAFQHYYQALKPGRWLSLEFHHAQASVWNALYDTLRLTGFHLHTITILDKIQGTFKQTTAADAVQHDLVLHAQKPKHPTPMPPLEVATDTDYTEVMTDLLAHAPLTAHPHRTAHMLFSRWLAALLLRGWQIPYDASEFYQRLRTEGVLRDAYWFLPDQVAAYNTWKAHDHLQTLLDSAQGRSFLCLTHEDDALLWLYDQLATPQSLAALTTAYHRVPKTAHAPADCTPLLTQYFATDGHHYFRSPPV